MILVYWIIENGALIFVSLLQYFQVFTLGLTSFVNSEGFFITSSIYTLSNLFGYNFVLSNLIRLVNITNFLGYLI